MRRSSPLSMSSSSPESQVRVSPNSQPSLEENSIVTVGSDTGAEDAHRLFLSGTLFPDFPEQVQAVFPQLDPVGGDFFGSVDQMDFLMDKSHIPHTTLAPSAQDNKATTEAQPATQLPTPPDLDAISTSTSSSSSCFCMMTAVSIYEAL
jgi:hypothetical protein